MTGWSAFRLVPPVAPEAMAWATVSFATFLAALEWRPQALGRMLDPLALALAVAVQLTLSTTRNLTTARWTASFRKAPRISVAVAAVIVAGVITLGLTASQSIAAGLFVLYYYLMHATLLWLTASLAPEAMPRLQATWTCRAPVRAQAVGLEAAGIAVSAAMLLSVWQMFGPLAFAAMMSFGVLVLRILSNWIIVLYLLDQDWGDTGDD